MPDSAASYLRTLHEVLARTEVTRADGAIVSLDQAVDDTVGMLQVLKRTGGKVMLIGNGGSAAIASHVQNDLCKAVGARALVMSEPPLLMALANDDGYETVFEQQIELWAQPDDILIAISSGGRSENILRGVRAAADHRCVVVTFSGFAADNPLRRCGAINYYLPSSAYGYVELSHSILLHLVTDRAMTALRPADGDVTQSP